MYTVESLLRIYRISSYKTLTRIIPAFLIMLAPGILLCRWNLVISNNTCSWRPLEKIIPAGLIWGNTVCRKLRENNWSWFYLVSPSKRKCYQWMKTYVSSVIKILLWFMTFSILRTYKSDVNSRGNNIDTKCYVASMYVLKVMPYHTFYFSLHTTYTFYLP